MSWGKDILGKHANVISGYAFKSNDFNNSGGIPVIKIKNIQKEHVEINDEYYVDNSFLGINDKFHCIKDDILISLTGSHITLPNSVVGRVAKYQYDFTSLLNQRAGKVLITNPSKLDNGFLYYFLCLQDTRITLAQFGRGGANQCNISPSNVESIDVILPPLPIQKKIASILSAYDDLIENNLKRIKLLEEAAQNIYKEWFVNFRFPGWENTRFDEETGLPEGWKKVILDDVCELIASGGTPSRNKKEYWNEAKYNWVKTKELRDEFIFSTEESLSEEGLMNSSAKIFPKGTILMAIYASPTLGRLGILHKEACFNQATVGFICNSTFISNHFLYYKLIEERGNLNAIAIGAAQQNISVYKVKNHEILLPKFNVIKEFTSVCNPIFNQKEILGNQNQKLKEARDILLPRLMNQTIEV